MAQIVFAEIGRRVGSALLPGGLSLPGFSLTGAQIGQSIGAMAGRSVDQMLAGPVGETGRIDGLTVLESREGAGVQRVSGRFRIGGQVIWATHLKERSSDRRVGGKGGPSVTEYSYTISFAVALCEGEISGVDRIWANGELLSRGDLNWRLYRGSEDQLPDPLIEAVEGVSPAYRGLAYMVFEDFPLDNYGARLPQLSFEVVRPVTGDKRTLADVVTGVNLIPASGEWVYAPSLVRRIEYPGWEETLNRHSGSGEIDVVHALDQLEADLPNVRSVNLTVSWFGTDLGCGQCSVRPGVETRDQINLPRDWHAGGVGRNGAHLISRDEDDRPYYGGTPDDGSVVALINELGTRGIAVTMSPFLLMDIPPGNGLADPYGGAEQAAFPWRGRITSSADKTAGARADVDLFFGTANASDFSLSGGEVIYSGPNEWSYRRFVLHLAMLAKAAGGVPGFLLGSELRGLTRLRDDTGEHPAVAHLIDLAGEVRSVLGAETEISYAADWTEYGAYVPEDGSGDVLFPLDDLWADEDIDYIGIDWYAPLSDWRDGDHLDGALFPAITDPDYLASNVMGGEGYDWFYASAADREAQIRTPIADNAHGEDWVFRVKDLRNWWQLAHHPRPDGARSAMPTSWSPQSKPIRLIEIGCGAIEKGSNAPNVFVDPKSDESGLPPFSDGQRDDAIQSAAIMALHDYWAPSAGNNPVSIVYGGSMIPADGLSVWCYDARPFPAFPVLSDVWSDGANWETGHWLNGRLTTSDLSAIIEENCQLAGVAVDVSAVSGRVPGYGMSGLSTVRDVLDPLAFAFSIRCRVEEDRLVFSNQEAGEAKEINAADLAFESERHFTASVWQRDMAEHGPRGVRVTLVDASADYQPSSIHLGERPEGDRDLHVRLPLSLDSTAARTLADAIYVNVNAAREQETLTLSPERMDIDVGDLVLLSGDTEPRRVVTRDHQSALTLGLVKPSAVFIGSQQLASLSPPSAHAPTPDLVVIDVPNLPGAEDDIRPLVGAFAYPWPGEIVVSAGVDAVAQTERTRLTKAAMIGRLLTPLVPGPADRFRAGLVLEIVFPDADLSSRSRMDVLNGQNGLAIETSEGWMLAAFEFAGQVSVDTWRLSGVLTGLSGTDDLACLGAVEGARVVVLDSALSRAELAHHEIGQALLWQGRGASAQAGSSRETLTIEGRALKPLRPGHLRASQIASGDIALSWTRRARHSADRWDTPDVPRLEDELIFQIDIVRDGETLRSTESSSPDWLYTQAMQSDDGVAALAGLTFRVTQMAPGFGAGVSAELAV